ncbi:hypothetical protein [Faecalibacter bovis]|uniref:Uncharacterized protein n=1 Tax=Faecalibacter bovis TaxID=2898187 RepID=A0ABX7XD24_9FLAO|nr:hypothetical protein [Faecalibacter bovis]QTV05817.1 hypothetical protein J9309_00245 [Faecalibacter bovis]
MKFIIKRIILYTIAFFALNWFSNSPLGIDQIYDKSISTLLKNEYLNYFFIVSGILVFFLIIKIIYKNFSHRPDKFFRRYFRIYGFVYSLNLVFTFFFYTYILSYTLFYIFLYINRIDTTSIISYPYQKHKNDIEDEIFLDFERNNYIDKSKTYIITTKYGLLNLPYTSKIETK